MSVFQICVDKRGKKDSLQNKNNNLFKKLIKRKQINVREALSL